MLQYIFSSIYQINDLLCKAHEQASKTLNDDGKLVSVFLSDLKKHGWLEVSLDNNDSRIRKYKLKSPEEAIKEMKR
ncbi:hypothetical protein HYX18_01155 [Candidatus Woesearchaeota archaeon]|nr:hypothetical protein [Candidatus Woesearchaeota archaeon]